MFSSTATAAVAAAAAAVLVLAASSAAPAAARSECDGMPDGTMCFGNDLVWCNNGDRVLWPTTCVRNCTTIVAPGSGSRPRAQCEQESAVCQNRPRLGSFCLTDNTVADCAYSGRYTTRSCSDGCVDKGLFAYCYKPPKCAPMSSDSAAALTFCPRPAYNVETSEDTPAGATDADEQARELMNEIADFNSPTSASHRCEYSAYLASCAAVFPECPQNNACMERCSDYNSCGRWYVDRNASRYSFVPVNCDNLCKGEQSAAPTAAAPIAAAALALTAALVW